MNKKLLLVTAFFVLTILSACGIQATQVPLVSAVPTNSNVSFANDVMPIIESRCVKCHGGESVKKGLDMTTYEGVIKGSTNGVVIEPGNADNSPLIESIVNKKMPKRGTKLTPEETQLFIDWVNSGAENN